jgi:F-type H+-transporting ATPase subunit a
VIAFAIVADNPLEHVVQHPLVTRPLHLGFLTPQGVVTILSNQIVMMLVAGLLLMLLVPRFVQKRRGGDPVGRLVPTGAGNAFEAVCVYLRKEVVQPTLEHHTDRFIKFIWTVFFFVLINNLLGLLPVGSLTPLVKLHIGGTPTGNIWVTGTLATMVFLMMVGNGIRLGGKEYFAHFCPGPLWLAPLLVPIEILGQFAKAFALAIRLFANMLAGHIMLAVLLGFILGVGSAAGILAGIGIAIPVILGSVFLNMLEILVAFLQAFIFTFLTSLFIGQAVVFHHDGQAGHAEEAHGH